MRLFWALELPEALRARLAEVQERLRRSEPDARVSWSSPEGMHLTLEFLGELAGDDAAERAAAAAAEGLPREGPLELAVEGLGGFGGRVLWAGLSGPSLEPLGRLAAHLERTARRLGVEPERRPYRGHVTLGRVRTERPRRPPRGRRHERAGRAGAEEAARGRAAVARLTALLRATSLGPLPFSARELVLVQSELGGGRPARYTARARLALTPPEEPASR